MSEFDAERTVEPPRHHGVAFDLHTLEAFIAVCETRSMTTAATRLGVTQSAVSHLIKQFEQLVGASLFDRTARPMVATATAKRLMPKVQRLLNESRQLSHAITQGQRLLPDLRIGLIDSLATPFLEQLIKKYRKETIAFSISSGYTTRLQEQFLAWELDVLIGGSAFDGVAGMECHELLKENFVLLIPRNFEQVDDLDSLRRLAARRPFIRSKPETDLGVRIERHLQRIRLEIPQSLAFNSIESMIAMVTEGAGWTIVPPISLRRSPSLTSLVQITPMPGPAFGRTLVLMARRGEHGDLPERMAGMSRRILSESYLPALFRAAPWLREQFQISS